MDDEDRFDIDIVAAVGSMMAAYLQFAGDEATDGDLAGMVVQSADYVLNFAEDDDVAAFARARALRVLGRSDVPVPVCQHSSACSWDDLRLGRQPDSRIRDALLTQPYWSPQIGVTSNDLRLPY